MVFQSKIGKQIKLAAEQPAKKGHHLTPTPPPGNLLRGRETALSGAKRKVGLQVSRNQRKELAVAGVAWQVVGTSRSGDDIFFVETNFKQFIKNGRK